VTPPLGRRARPDPRARRLFFLIHDERRLSLPVAEILRFAKVEDIEVTARFEKQLRKLPR